MSEAETKTDASDKPEATEAKESKPPAAAKKTAAKKTAAAEKPAEKVEAKKPDEQRVVLEDLKIGTTDSESVRRLQEALGTNVTGDFEGGTQRALKAWQNKRGFEGGRGIQVGAEQAKLLFGDAYKIV
jgi:peptidoglycan hydrolase-like protein with peptidoglycan-binding domain